MVRVAGERSNGQLHGVGIRVLQKLTVEEGGEGSEELSVSEGFVRDRRLIGDLAGHVRAIVIVGWKGL